MSLTLWAHIWRCLLKSSFILHISNPFLKVAEVKDQSENGPHGIARRMIGLLLERICSYVFLMLSVDILLLRPIACFFLKLSASISMILA